MWRIIHGIAFLGTVFSPETSLTFHWTGQDGFTFFCMFCTYQFKNGQKSQSKQEIFVNLFHNFMTLAWGNKIGRNFSSFGGLKSEHFANFHSLSRKHLSLHCVVRSKNGNRDLGPLILRHYLLHGCSADFLPRSSVKRTKAKQGAGFQ